MPGKDIVLDHGNIKALLNGREVVADLTNRGGRVLTTAQGSAPSPEYRDGLRLVLEHTDRARVLIESTTGDGRNVEAKHGTLRRALDSAGGA